MGEWIQVCDAALYDEHLALGAVFSEDEPLLALPARYGVQVDVETSVEQGCLLADLDGISAVLVGGQGSGALIQAACAGLSLGVGACAFAAVLSGDGSLLALPLVARTGDTEYLLWDATERGTALCAWLGFLAGIEQQGMRAFDDVAVEDVSSSLHPLLLCGTQATAVLADYLASGEECPSAGTVCAISLDSMRALVVGVPFGGTTCYLVLVPPREVCVLWRSLLSFGCVEPVGSEGLDSLARDWLSWHERIMEPGQLALARSELEEWGVLHAPDGFVGVRGLAG